MSDLERARAAAATLLAERGYHQEAELVRAGEGDDFAEVRMATELLHILARPAAPAPVAAFRRRLVGEEC